MKQNRVLLIHDTSFAFDSTRILSDLGPSNSGDAVHTLAEAAARLGANNYDCIVAAPGGGGVDAGALKALPGDRPMVILFVPGVGDGVASIGLPATYECLWLDGEGKLLNQLPSCIERAFSRHRQTQALAEEKERYQKLVTNLQEGIWVINRVAVTTFVNPRMAEMLGYTANDMIGRHLFSFMDEQGKAICENNLKRREEGITETHDFELITRSGARIYTMMATFPLTDPQGNYDGAVAAVSDVTQRRAIESRERASKALLLRLLDALPMAAYICDKDGLMTYFNQEAAQLWGQTPTLGQRDETFCASLCGARMATSGRDGHDRDDICWYQKASGELSDVRGVHVDIKRPDGTIRTCIAYSSTSSLESVLDGAVNILIDVTEAKRSEETILELHGMLKQAVDAGNVGLWNWDLVTNAVAFSDEWKRQLGYEPHEIRSHISEWLDRLHPEDRDRALKSAEDYRDGRTHSHNIDFRLRHRDGSYRTILAQGTLFKDASGNPVRMIGSHIDITDWQKFRMDAARRESRFMAIYDRALMGVAEVDALTGQYISVNPMYCKMLGRSMEEMLSRTWQDLTHPDDIAACERYKSSICGARDVPDNIEKRYMKPDGSVVWGSLLLSKLELPGEKREVFIKLVQDITHKRTLEEASRQAQKMESIGRLAAGIAHDFNNMLAVIEMNAAEIRNTLNGKAPVGGPVEEISAAVTRAASMTQQLLLFARKQPMLMMPIDLGETVSQFVKTLGRLLGEQIELQWKEGPEKVVIHADQGMIHQVLLNLSVNARDAMPNGGVLSMELGGIEIQPGRDGLDLKMDRRGRFACLRIKDTGCGMPEELIPKIFDPFFTTKSIGEGTGLGLATVHGIVSQHGGWLDVTSREGQGSEFCVYLPCATGDMVRTRADHAPNNGTAFGRNSASTILLVEDDVALRLSIRTGLRRMGYGVIEASSGEEAWKLWYENRAHIGLLLTDMVLTSGIGGRQLAKQIRDHDPDFPIVYMSGYSPDLTEYHGEHEEGIVFLPKPFSAEKLADAIGELLAATR